MKLLEYVVSIYKSVETICHDNISRKRLALNMAENDRQILEILKKKSVIKEEGKSTAKIN